MVCHGEMARTRPGPSQLTEFYFLMSLGGVLGGLFNSLLAPQLFGSVQIFDSVVEYPLMLVAACFLLPGQKGANQRRAFNHIDFAWLTGLIVVMGACVGFALMLDSLKWTSPMMAGMKRNLIIAVLYGLPAIMCLGFKERPIRFALGVAFLFLTMDYYSRAKMGNVLLAERNFFGVNRVLLDKKHKYHTLVNGNTLHGLQEMFPKPSREPTGYYCRSGPLGDVFEALSGPMLKRRVAVIGLGTGGMAAYAQPEQRFSFYEIDPAVVEIARNPELFTYLTDCRGTYDIVLGDARIQLAQAADAEFDMIVLDAFSSDSIPMHLLTQEAMELYWHKLKADGVLVLHISNRYLRLEPTLGRLAAANGLVCLSRADLDVNQEEQQKGKRPSQYMVMAREAGNLGRLTENTHWSLSKSTGNAKIWTDDYSDILHVLRW
jgi:SAM-dependent methyltransferase